MIYKNNKELKSISIGGKTITEIYYGDKLVWPRGIPTVNVSLYFDEGVKSITLGNKTYERDSIEEQGEVNVTIANKIRRVDVTYEPLEILNVKTKAQEYTVVYENGYTGDTTCTIVESDNGNYIAHPVSIKIEDQIPVHIKLGDYITSVVVDGQTYDENTTIYVTKNEPILYEAFVDDKSFIGTTSEIVEEQDLTLNAKTTILLKYSPEISSITVNGTEYSHENKAALVTVNIPNTIVYDEVKYIPANSQKYIYVDLGEITWSCKHDEDLSIDEDSGTFTADKLETYVIQPYGAYEFEYVDVKIMATDKVKFIVNGVEYDTATTIQVFKDTKIEWYAVTDFGCEPITLNTFVADGNSEHIISIDTGEVKMPVVLRFVEGIEQITVAGQSYSVPLSKRTEVICNVPKAIDYYEITYSPPSDAMKIVYAYVDYGDNEWSATLSEGYELENGSTLSGTVSPEMNEINIKIKKIETNE